jgi:hypothetical protein
MAMKHGLSMTMTRARRRTVVWEVGMAAASSILIPLIGRLIAISFVNKTIVLTSHCQEMHLFGKLALG